LNARGARATGLKKLVAVNGRANSIAVKPHHILRPRSRQAIDAAAAQDLRRRLAKVRVVGAIEGDPAVVVAACAAIAPARTCSWIANGSSTVSAKRRDTQLEFAWTPLRLKVVCCEGIKIVSGQNAYTAAGLHYHDHCSPL